MTEWTPEEAVARAIDGAFNRGETLYEIASAAIAALHPRWRDVRTDPPPHGQVVIATDGKGLCFWQSDYDPNNLRRFVGLPEFIPTHWQYPPLPTAPEDQP